MSKLDPARIEEIVRDCLYKEDEISDGATPAEAVLVNGITKNFGFHPGRLEKHRAEIASMLDELPAQFSEGGGWSFLNMCMDRHGEQWTGLHRVQELLMVLGLGSGLMRYCLPREMWHMMPGSVPYVVVVRDEVPHGTEEGQHPEQARQV